MISGPGSLAALVGAAGSAGIHLLISSALSRSWWRLPPGQRGRAAGSFHRFGGAPRAWVGALALAGLLAEALTGGGPGAWVASLLAAAALLCALPALPLERRLVKLYYDAAGPESDREFIEAQSRWDRWNAVRLALWLAVLAVLIL